MIDCIYFKIEKLHDDLKKKIMDRSGGKINRAKLINRIHFETVSEQNLATASKLVTSSAADHVLITSSQDWKRSIEKTFINKRSDEENLISCLFGGYKTNKSDETAANNSAIKFHIPLINVVILIQKDNSIVSILNASRFVTINKLKSGEKDDRDIR